MTNSQLISGTLLLLLCLAINLKYSMTFGQSTICNLYFNGSCIVYVNTSMTWGGAEMNCVQLGGHLVSIHSATENLALSDYGLSAEYQWIGYNDNASEGNFVWSDGSIVDYINWLPNQPDNHLNNENCANYLNTDQWNDAPCTVVLTSFCKISGVPFAANVTISSTYVPSTSCTGTITLTWPAVTSYSEVTSYAVLLNGTNISTTTPTVGQNTYTTGELNLLEHYATYSVVATSSAGSNTSSPVMFTPPIFSVPLAATITISTTYVPSTSCTGTITITWPAVASDRVVTSYKVLLNGTDLVSVSPTAGQNTYTTGVLNLLEHYAAYTVVAISCAGSSTSSPVMFTPPIITPPSAATITIATTSVPSISCTGTITLTWPAVTSDREVTSYEVLLNGSNIVTTTPTTGINTYTTGVLNLLEYYATYTVVATSCAGSNTSSPVMFAPSVLTPPSAANITISTTYVSSTSCTGTITLTWPAVTSDKEVTSYEVLLNGTSISTTTPTAGANTYTTSMMSLDGFTGTYTVRAISCVGSSVSNEVVFTAPTLPTTPSVTYVTGDSNSYIVFTMTSTGDVHYIQINDNTDRITPTTNNVYTYTGSIFPMYGDYNFSIAAGNCIGNSTYSPSILIIGAVKTTTPTTTITTIITTPATDLPTNSTSTSCPASDSKLDFAACATTIPIIAVVLILVLLLLVCIVIIITCLIVNIYLLKKNKKSPLKAIGQSPTSPDTYVYNFVDMNTLDASTTAEPFYTDMAPIPTASTNRSGYINPTKISDEAYSN